MYAVGSLSGPLTIPVLVPLVVVDGDSIRHAHPAQVEFSLEKENHPEPLNCDAHVLPGLGLLNMESEDELEQVAQERILVPVSVVVARPVDHPGDALGDVGSGDALAVRRERGRLPERRVREDQVPVALKQRRVCRKGPERASRQRLDERLQRRCRSTLAVALPLPRIPHIHGRLDNQRLDPRHIGVLGGCCGRCRARRPVAALRVAR